MQHPGLRAWGPPLGPLYVPSTQPGSSSGRAGGLSDRPDIWHVCTAPISPVQTHTGTPQPLLRQEQRLRVSSWPSGTAPLLRVAPAWSRPHGELVWGAEGRGGSLAAGALGGFAGPQHQAVGSPPRGQLCGDEALPAPSQRLRLPRELQESTRTCTSKQVACLLGQLDDRQPKSGPAVPGPRSR